MATDPTSTAVFGDGVLTFDIPDDLTQRENVTMPIPGEMDPVICKTMDQNFVNNNRRMDEAGQRHVSSAAFIDQQAQMTFMLSTQLFQAKAAGQLDRDSLAKSRLDAGAVGNPVVVVPKT